MDQLILLIILLCLLAVVGVVLDELGLIHIKIGALATGFVDPGGF